MKLKTQQASGFANNLLYYDMIYYGTTWHSRDSDITTMESYMTGLSSTSWWKILGQYLKTEGSLTYGASTIVTEYKRKSLDDAHIRGIIVKTFNVTSGQPDPNAIYVFVAGTEVGTIQGAGGGTYCGFVQGFCGYHGSFTVGGQDLKYVVAGMTCPFCGDSNPLSALMITLSHEISETMTDPLAAEATKVAYPLAWYAPPRAGLQEGEIGDLCNGIGVTQHFPASNADYKVQLIWDNASGQCSS
ncbi:hypothetical protein HDU76_009766 [Blyttiomyces sp. JEL0837]|nr:hypothetical protein HDU76_009766 [Blyttiomyces sp. JEL0837]